MSIIYTFAEITASFLEQLFLLFCGGLFFERRIAKSHVYHTAIILTSIVCTAFITYLNSISLYSYATLAIGIILFAAALFAFNKVNIFHAICLPSLYMVVISSFDFLFLSFVEYVLKVPGFIMSTINGASPERLITLSVSKGILVLVVLVIKKKKLKFQVSNTTATALIVLSVLSFFAMQYLVAEFVFSTESKIREVILITFAFMALFFTAVLLFINENDKKRRKVKETERIESDLKITQERNEELIGTYQEIAKISHDFKNQMRVTLLMLKNGSVAEAQDYLSGIVEVLADSTQKYTGISSIDTVLSEKARVATENEIKTEFDIALLSLCGVNSLDLCSILLNLIDNAIEACLKLDDKSKRDIKIVLKNVNSMIFLKIENSFDQNNSEPSLAKKNKAMHGYGLTIVRSIVEKYNGSFIVNSKQNRFVVTILL